MGASSRSTSACLSLASDSQTRYCRRQSIFLPVRPFMYKHNLLPSDTNTLRPADLLSIIGIRSDASGTDADNVDFWLAVIRDVLLREEKLCNRWW